MAQLADAARSDRGRRLAAVGGSGRGLRRLTSRSTHITYEIPIPAPEKIICVGVNYPDRNEEYKDGQDAPPNPSLFVRFPALLRRPWRSR